jgi:hypothetical protein
MKSLKIFIISISLLIITNTLLFSQTAVIPAEGTGSELSPYEIATLSNLYWIADNSSRWDYYYIQTAKIDASDTEEWFDGDGWLPIGNATTKFSGSYDGQGYTISGLYINRPTEGNVGLFGHFGHPTGQNTQASTIRKVNLTGVTVIGGRGTGTLVGRITGNTNTLIECCTAENGSVVGDGATGGLVGSNNSYRETPGGTDNSLIRSCYADINVSLSNNPSAGKDKFGGLSGCNQKGTILNSYALGSVTAEDSGAERIGGIAGCADLRGMIEKSYSIGQVNGQGSSLVGGLVGNLSGPGSNVGVVEDSFWNTQTSGQSTSAGGTGKTTTEMKDIDTFTNTATVGLDEAWDFTDIWAMDENENDGYPYLQCIEFVEDTPLPVELSSFTAVITSDLAVNLQWRAETETNLLGYNVFRSITNTLDESFMINLNLINAYNSSTAVSYNYIDDEVHNGQMYYYWLQSVEYDLTTDFHGPVSVVVEYEEDSGTTPVVLRTELISAYPNPFNPATAIKFSLAESAEVTIEVYNMLGQSVQTLLKNQNHPKGTHSIIWDGKDNSGKNVVSGIYFYRMVTSQGYEAIKKMVLMK